MKVLVNNKEVKTGASTLSQLIEELALPTQGIAIAVDNHIVLRTEWPKICSEGIYVYHHHQKQPVEDEEDEVRETEKLRNAVHHALHGTILDLDAARMALEAVAAGCNCA